MDERQKLIEELFNFLYNNPDDSKITFTFTPKQICDFILQDRKRVVEPLVKFITDRKYYKAPQLIIEALSETLSNAGVAQ